MEKLGKWSFENGMPRFAYLGALPYREVLPNGKKVNLPEDPFFLLGNPQISIFARVGGEMELITGRRSWGRMNFGTVDHQYDNQVVLNLGKEKYCLTGTDGVYADPGVTQREFGCGFARYCCRIGEVVAERTWSVAPPKDVKGGEAAALVTVKIQNNGEQEITGNYQERIGALYREIQYQYAPVDTLPVRFTYHPFENQEMGEAGFAIQGACMDPLLAHATEDMSKWEAFPPYVAVKALDGDAKVIACLGEGENENPYLSIVREFSLAKGESVCFQFVVGILHGRQAEEIEELAEAVSREGKLLFPGESSGLQGETDLLQKWSIHEDAWKEYLPSFDDETDKSLRRELIWHSYCLEAMATYSEFYDETKIPQGTCYDYLWGKHASARDNFQHALPLAYFRPAMCKSVLRYMMMRTTAFGEVRLIESGVGYAEHEGYFTSDQQLFFFLLMTEYLRVTGDLAFLGERIRPYPVRGQAEMTVLEMIKSCFVFLRDNIGTGAHGIIKLCNSDWNDTIYYIEKVPYHTVFLRGESHMNSAMAVSILERLIPQVRAYGQRADQAQPALLLAESMEQYRKNIYDAFMKDLGDRAFPRRMYFNNMPYGEDNMFLEPMGYTLWMKDFPIEKKQTLYEEMKKRLYENEILGAREQQNPQFESETYEKGSRENGGFWWALNAPVIMGLSTFDPAEAAKRESQMTLQHLEDAMPQYWTSYWSAADNVESSLIPENGLPDQSENYADQPVYCAHPHAWIVYLYYYLRDPRIGNGERQ